MKGSREDERPAPCGIPIVGRGTCGNLMRQRLGKYSARRLRDPLCGDCYEGFVVSFSPPCSRQKTEPEQTAQEQSEGSRKGHLRRN